MSDTIKISDTLNAILNPSTDKVYGEFSLKQEVLPEGSVIVDESISEISIIDLKGKHFKFPGEFQMVREGSKITFKAIR